MKIGDSFEENRTFLAEDIENFCRLSGDFNFLHLDGQEDYGRFSGPIVHGALVLGVFSKIIGTNLPGPGTIYLSQNMSYTAPLYVGSPGTFSVCVKEITGKIVKLSQSCIDSSGKEICRGSCTVLNDSIDETALSEDDIIKGLQSVGIKRGDLILVHSSFKSFGRVIGGPQAVVNAMLRTIGEAGTLVVPTFNFDFCDGVPYDYKNTKSQMGAITEIVRNNQESSHVRHPIYSFSAIGALKHDIGAINNVSSYGSDSFFSYLAKNNGKIVVFGLSYNDSMTFFHHVEEMTGCGYRHMKEFSGEIIDEDGKIEKKTYTMNARDIEHGVVTAVDAAGTVLEAMGLVKICKIGKCNVKVMSAGDVFNAVKTFPVHFPDLLRKIKE
jgi:aminoglycoside 3-N-acetyltransferase